MPKSRIKSRRLVGLNNHERLRIIRVGRFFQGQDSSRWKLLLKSCPQSYKRYVSMDFSVYLKSISKNGEWDDHVTLQAAADAFRLKITVITSFRDTSSTELLLKSQKFDRIIYLSFWTEVHYKFTHLNGGSDTDTTFMELQRKNKKE
ncbi:hypothetical protein OROMI_031352 [Orobanche minor]